MIKYCACGEWEYADDFRDNGDMCRKCLRAELDAMAREAEQSLARAVPVEPQRDDPDATN